MHGILEQVLLDHWAALAPGRPKPGRVWLSALTPFNRAPNAKAYLFAVADRARAPFAYVKIARDAGSAAFLDTSHASLRALEGDPRVADLRHTFPRSVLLTDLAGHRVNVETYLPGRDVQTMVRAGGADPTHRRTRERVLRWITSFHGRTRVEAKLGEERVDRMLEAPIEEMRRLFPGQGWLARYLDRLEERMAELRGTPLPLVFFHNSLATKNVKLTGTDIAVIDWEQSVAAGLPLVDLQHFLMTFWSGCRRVGYEAAAAAALGARDPLGFFADLRRYEKALGLAPELRGLLLAESFFIRARMVTGYRDRVLECCRLLAEREVGLAA